MAEYIDREKVIEEIYSWLDSVGSIIIGKGLSSYGELIGCMQDVPTADVVEVVRCRDCKYWDKVKNPKHAGKGICISPNKSIGGYCTRKGATLENDYCSYGARMDGETDDR